MLIKTLANNNYPNKTKIITKLNVNCKFYL